MRQIKEIKIIPEQTRQYRLVFERADGQTCTCTAYAEFQKSEGEWVIQLSDGSTMYRFVIEELNAMQKILTELNAQCRAEETE
jgi:hypothetical protein